MPNNYFKLFLLCSLVLLNSGCFRFLKHESGQNKHSQAQAFSKAATHHQVKAGETLYSIAFEYGRDHRDIARWNRIRRPYTIYPKQKLRIVPINSDGKTKKLYSKNKYRNSSSRKSVSVDNKVHYVANSKLKWRWPTKGKVTSTFSIRDPGRRSIEISGRQGQPVKAAAAGRVVYRGKGLRGLGNLIILKHNETYFSAYAHTENMVIKENEKVKLGQKLADMGNTGSEKTKLHFEIRRNGKPVNPLRYLPKRR
jgi:lipoprotein NlpD